MRWITDAWPNTWFMSGSKSSKNLAGQNKNVPQQTIEILNPLMFPTGGRTVSGYSEDLFQVVLVWLCDLKMSDPDLFALISTTISIKDLTSTRDAGRKLKAAERLWHEDWWEEAWVIWETNTQIQHSLHRPGSCTFKYANSDVAVVSFVFFTLSFSNSDTHTHKSKPCCQLTQL